VALTWEERVVAPAASPGAERPVSALESSAAGLMAVQLPAPVKGRSLGAVAARGSRHRMIRLRRAR
jgi:hypothetical protein